MADIDATQRVIKHLLTHFAGQAGGERNNLNGRFQERREKASMTGMGAKQTFAGGISAPKPVRNTYR